jgi:hypothetical protein
MAQEGKGDQAAKAKETIEQGQRELKRIQELALKGIMNDEEAAEFVREARGKIEKAERQIEAMKRQAKVKGELAGALTLLMNSNLSEVIEGLDDASLRQLCRQVVKQFTVEKWGNGPGRQCAVSACEFTPEFQDLLAEVPHLSEIARYFRVASRRSSNNDYRRIQRVDGQASAGLPIAAPACHLGLCPG